MIIGRKPFPAQSTIRYEVDYSNWLEPGRTIETAVVAILADPVTGLVPTDITLGSITTSSMSVFIFVHGATPQISNSFTVQVEITDTLGETVLDTVIFNVIPE